MSGIPAAFVLSLLLVVMLVRLSAASNRRLGVFPRAALAIYAVQTVLLGLKWGYGVTLSWPLQGVIATLIPPLTWFAMRSMVSGKSIAITPAALLQICGPAVLVLLPPLVGFPVVDIVIGTVFVAYGIALLYVTFQEDLKWLDRIPFHGLVSTNAAFRAAGSVLIASALIDLAVSYDISTTGGSFAPNIVGISNLVILVVLSASIALVGNFAPTATSQQTVQELFDEAEATGQSFEELQAQYVEILGKLDTLMISKRVYRDPNLSLDRLARKLLIPSRQISAAINSRRAMNVPQYVNMFRIMEACQILRNTNEPITGVIFDVGFQTKSNFNREFQRIVGLSPTIWRQDRKTGDRSATMETFVSNLLASMELSKGDVGSLFPLPNERM